MKSIIKKDSVIRVFFASNAMTSIIILGLITIFLFKEGIEFFGQYRHELERYRKSGMEYATVVSSQHNDQTTLYRYLESILSKEVAHLESLPKNDPNREKGEQGRQELLALTRSFQDTKELLLSYEKEVVKWAAETKLFLITKSDLIEVKSEAIEQKLPTEDFPETIDELEERTSFTHRELARWRNYFIRNGREDLAKRINPKVGDEMGTAEKGEINDLTDRIRTSATIEYAKVTDAQEKQFSDLFSGFQPTFLCRIRKIPRSSENCPERIPVKVPLYKERLTLWNPEQPYPLHRQPHWFFARQGLGYQRCSAGLVRRFASAFRIIARQLDRLGFGHSVRRWFGDLREPNRHKAGTIHYQTFYRIYFCHSIGTDRFFRDRRFGWNGQLHRGRTLEFFNRRLSFGLDDGAYDFHLGRGCSQQCPESTARCIPVSRSDPMANLRQGSSFPQPSPA